MVIVHSLLLGRVFFLLTLKFRQMLYVPIPSNLDLSFLGKNQCQACCLLFCCWSSFKALHVMPQWLVFLSLNLFVILGRVLAGSGEFLQFIFSVEFAPSSTVMAFSVNFAPFLHLHHLRMNLWKPPRFSAFSEGFFFFPLQSPWLLWQVNLDDPSVNTDLHIVTIFFNTVISNIVS